MTSNNCPKCEGAIFQPTYISNGHTVHGGLECEECGWTEADGQPCEKCGVYVPAGQYCGHDRADGTSEYLCPDCYNPDAPRPCADCERPVAYCNKCERWEHVNGETCFLCPPACEGGPHALSARRV